MRGLPRPRALCGYVPPREPHAAGEPYASSAELRADLDIIARSLAGNGSAALAERRLRPLERAVEVFGFHLASLDLRQNSAVHEEVVAELLRLAGVHGEYAALAEPERIALLTRELAGPRLLYSRHLSYSATVAGELEILQAAADIHRRFGAIAIQNYIISHCESVSDLLEVGLLLKEVGLLAPGAPARLELNIVPLFETIADLGRCGSIMSQAFALEPYRLWLDARGRVQGGDARLLRQQQGRRLSQRQLGAVPGRSEPGRGCSGNTASACACSMGAAARSAAAAGPPTRPSWRSPRAAWTACCA